MRYELSDYEWTAIKPMLPNKPRGVRRVNDRRVLGGIFCLQNRMETAALEARKPRARSRVTNGNELFATNEPVDGRSMASRRFRDILGQIVADLGGSDRLSEAQKQLCRRVSLMCWECERLEARLPCTMVTM